MMMQICRVLLVVALVVAPMPALAVGAAVQTSQQESADNSEEPASINPAGALPAGEKQPQEIVRVIETVYITETLVLTEIVPITETVVVTEVVAVEQIVPVTETVVVTEVVTVEQIVPVTETVVVTEVVAVEQIVPVTETVVVTEVVAVEQIVPVTETVVVTEVVAVEQIVPVTETVVVTEVVTVEQIVPVTETVAGVEAAASSTKEQAVEPSINQTPASKSQAEEAVTALPISETDPTSSSTTAASQKTGAARPLTHWSQLTPAYSEPTPLPVTGLAMYYAPRVMDGVASYRERVNNIEECEECIGRVALLRAGDIGRHVWIQVGDGVVEGPFQVLDVAGRHHIPDLLRRNWVVDVDYETAMRWGMRGPIEVTVYAEPPARIAIRPTQPNEGKAP
ncbi:MAG: hypothetical protein BroJett021_24940 [Chloroflexota bacterium]|nr:MAG: hypothetical protein BroJett021_24940 [Chloroflexota bacterium]